MSTSSAALMCSVIRVQCAVLHARISSEVAQGPSSVLGPSVWAISDLECHANGDLAPLNTVLIWRREFRRAISVYTALEARPDVRRLFLWTSVARMSLLSSWTWTMSMKLGLGFTGNTAPCLKKVR